MDWSYIGGYSDGEGCFMMYISKDRRLDKTKGSAVTGWNITPMWSLQTYDHDVLFEIKKFIESNGIKVAKMDIKKRRAQQTDDATRLTICGWPNLVNFFSFLLPYCIDKKPQYDVFLKELIPLKQSLPLGKNYRKVWTKKKFIEAMEYVDKLNSFKKGLRGKLNAQYFRDLWKDEMQGGL